MGKKKIKIRCIVSDLDGTLLKKFSWFFFPISNKTFRELDQFCSDNRKLILASGRDLESTKKIAEKIERKINKNIIPYLICMNGAVIFDNYWKRIVSSSIFESNSCWNVINFLLKKKIAFFLITKNKEIVLRKSPCSIFIYFLFFRRYKLFFFKRSESSFFKNIQKISLISFFPTNKKIRKEISENFGDIFYFSSISNFYLEIIDKKINKFYAWKVVSKKMGVSEHEWCAIGNEENDLLLLENSCFGVFVDPKKAKHLSLDQAKVNFQTSNKRGFAVGSSIEELRKHQYY